MSKLSLREIAQSQLDSTPVIDGQLIVCLDTGNAYRDTATAHVKIGSDLEVVSDLPLAPLAEKLYYLKPDKLYVFLGGNWTLLNDKTIDLDESIAKLPAGSSTDLNDDVEIITQDTDFTQPHYYRRKLVVLWEYIKAKAQDFFAAKDHKHKKADITDFPTSMPASDVHPWAKEATKPSYTKAEIGLGKVDNTADADKTVKRATTAGTADTANSVTWENVKDKPTTFPVEAHNHDDRYYTEAEVNSKLNGKVDNTEAGANGLLSKLSVWTATPTDDTYFMRQDTGGTNQFGRVKFSTIWNYIKSKADGTYQPKGSYAASNHNHDDRYYTEAEVDGKLSGKSNIGHTHDDRYYTESEIDSKLSGKADTKHIHLNGTVNGNVDWNTFITYGVYKIQNCTMSDDYHAPNPEYQYGILQVLDSENNVGEKRILQIYWPHSTAKGNHLWYRMHNSSDINTGWSGWTQIKKKPDTAGVADYANALSGLSSRSSQGWGVQTGTFVHGECDSTGGDFAFRRDCPNAGQMSMVIDGRFYQNEGAYRVLDTSDEPNLNVNSANYINDVGDRRTLSFAYSKNGLAYGDYSWLAGWNGNELRAVDKNQFATAGHTHNYAGSTSPGGAANSANTLNPTVILTRGDGNTPGYRLIGQVSMNKWGNYRCVMLVNSRHQGAGLVTVTIGNNTDTITQGNAYAEIKYWGPTGSGSVISSSAYQVYISDDGKTGYLFWMYWDYSPCYVRVLGSDFTISNGTWMTGIGSGYGKCIATTQVNAASTANYLDYFKCTSSSNVGIDDTSANAIGYVNNISLLGQGDGALYKQVYNNAWVHEIYGDYRTGQIALRGKNNGTWQGWRTVLDSSNYSSYALPLTGGTLTGALHIRQPNSGSYNEHIRLHPSSNNWTCIAMCGDDNTGDSGTSAKTWGIFTFNGEISIAKNGTSLNGNSSNASLTCKSDNVWRANNVPLLTTDSGIPKGGGTMSGALNFANGTWNLVGDDAYMGDHNIGGSFCIMGANDTTRLALVNKDNQGDYALIEYGGGNLNFSKKLGANITGHADGDLALSGGTLTGDIAFSNCGTGTRQIQFTCADNDYGRIAVGGTASNAGYMEIATADDGTEPIYVRQYSGIYASIVRSATLLDGSGNTTFPGYVTGERFYTGDWFRATGNSGFYFENHGGGWYMTDDTWIRAYNSKNIYTPGVIQCDGGFNGSLNGNANTATLIRHQGNVTAISGTDKRTSGLQLYGAYANGYPMSYGNVICASNGAFGSEIALDCVGGGGKQGPGRMYYRNRSDWGTSEWSDWATVAYLTDKVAGANHADSADSATALNMNSAGNGNSIYGSGNDAVNGPGGGLNNVVISSWYGVSFTSPCGVGYGGKNQTAVGIDCREGIVKAARFDGSLNGTATNAEYLGNDAAYMRMHWNGQSGQPTWLWGGNDASNMYVYNPSNFSVNYANSAGNGILGFQTKVTDDGQFGAVRFNDGIQICWFTMKNTRNKTFLLPFVDTNYAIAFSGGYCWLDVDSRTTTGFTTGAQWSGYENSYIAIGRWR